LSSCINFKSMPPVWMSNCEPKNKEYILIEQ
jgi:hypothetical protein